MDTTVLYKLTYGLYIVGAFIEGRPAGCVINTCFQVTSRNPLLTVSLNKNNHTLEAIRQNRRFSLSILSEDSSPELIGRFGFFSSRDTDKYAAFGYDVVNYTPCVRGSFAGRLFLEAEQFIDCDTHVLVLARLTDTLPGTGTPMTYAYYHNVIKGSAPANAPTYRGSAGDEDKAESSVKKRYQCDVCQYIVEAEGDLPDDFTCPLCGADRSHFKEV